ncbi:hypothetical protein GCM10020331_093240 [Ectobacillus funiculus]
MFQIVGKKHVYDEDGNINRHYYELAALTELRNHIRSGDIFVDGSRQHKAFDDYLVSQDDWKKTQLVFKITLRSHLKLRNI